MLAKKFADRMSGVRGHHLMELVQEWIGGDGVRALPACPGRLHFGFEVVRTTSNDCEVARIRRAKEIEVEDEDDGEGP